MRHLLIALPVVIAAGVVAPAADAASIFEDAGSGDLVYQSPDDPSRDHVDIHSNGAELVFRFDSALHQGGVFAPDCTTEPSDGVTFVRCIPTTRLVMHLGDGDDYVNVEVTGVPVPIVIDGGPGDDQFHGGAERDQVSAGPGRDLITTADGPDTVDGGPGPDEISMGSGADSAVALDGTGERVDCGEGTDLRVTADTIDDLSGCEDVQRSNALESDRDHDGFSRQFDCNDGAASINPAAVDVPDNGVDENCDGKDAHVADRDGDGVPVPFDCNDANRAIRPGRSEVPGNAVDENCDGRAAPLQTVVVTPIAAFTSAQGGAIVRVRRLRIEGLARKSTVTLRCRGGGCRLTHTVRTNRHSLDLSRFLRRGSFRHGARLTIAVKSPGALVTTIVFRIRPPAVPTPVISCRKPGAKKSAPCVRAA